MSGVGKAVGTLLILYFMFDFFLWNGGIVNPSILQRIADVSTFIVVG
jgi:hypothetical protein